MNSSQPIHAVKTIIKEMTKEAGKINTAYATEFTSI